MSLETVVLVNPHSRSGQTGRKLPLLERLLRKHLVDYELWPTEREGDGIRLAQKALEQGATRLVAAGGDGTLSEVVSGLASLGRSERAEVGLLPLGSGGDFARLLGLGRDLEVAVARLNWGSRRKVDLGKVTCLDVQGQSQERWFLNIASFGLSAEAVVWLTEQGRRGKRGPLSYLESGLRTLATYRTPSVNVRVDGREVHAGKLLLGAVANGQYFGGGMRVAPGAQLDDGAFDLVMAGALSKLSALWMFPRMMLGRHLSHPLLSAQRGRRIELTSNQEVWLEADGEPVGLLPATLELAASSVTLCGLP